MTAVFLAVVASGNPYEIIFGPLLIVALVIATVILVPLLVACFVVFMLLLLTRKKNGETAEDDGTMRGCSHPASNTASRTRSK